MMSDQIAAWVDGALTPMDKMRVHHMGLRHPAVSVFLTSGDTTLIQQRAMTKYHTPGLWANACCTHPHWNEAPLICAHRRLAEELGITGVTLTHAGQIEYRADVGAGLIEHELVDIFVGHMSQVDIVANPAEVMDHRWIPWSDLRREMRDEPARFTPWLHIYLDQNVIGD